VVLAKIFAEVLKLERVGVNDNFFHLGGHSLLASRVMDLIKSELGDMVDPIQLFASPTVAELAKHIKPPLPIWKKWLNRLRFTSQK
jgi:acyl carrier protein